MNIWSVFSALLHPKMPSTANGRGFIWALCSVCMCPLTVVVVVVLGQLLQFPAQVGRLVHALFLRDLQQHVLLYQPLQVLLICVPVLRGTAEWARHTYPFHTIVPTLTILC